MNQQSLCLCSPWHFFYALLGSSKDCPSLPSTPLQSILLQWQLLLKEHIPFYHLPWQTSDRPWPTWTSWPTHLFILPTADDSHASILGLCRSPYPLPAQVHNKFSDHKLPLPRSHQPPDSPEWHNQLPTRECVQQWSRPLHEAFNQWMDLHLSTN